MVIHVDITKELKKENFTSPLSLHFFLFLETFKVIHTCTFTVQRLLTMTILLSKTRSPSELHLLFSHKVLLFTLIFIPCNQILCLIILTHTFYHLVLLYHCNESHSVDFSLPWSTPVLNYDNFPRTPRSAGSQGYTQYQWTSPGCKPSSPFIATEKKKEALIEQSKPRPGTAEAEIEGRKAH